MLTELENSTAMVAMDGTHFLTLRNLCELFPNMRKLLPKKVTLVPIYIDAD